MPPDPREAAAPFTDDSTLAIQDASGRVSVDRDGTTPAQHARAMSVVAPLSSRRQKPSLPLYVAAVGAALAGAAAQAASTMQDGCSRTVVLKATSPDHARSAVLLELVCGAGGYAQDVTAEVRIGATAVLGVDTGGHSEERPRLSWASPVLLDVTVRDLSFLPVSTLKAGDVRVRLHFDPPDPAAREQ